MCRFAAYIGENQILIDELLEKPKNSLVSQSHDARAGMHPVNADGFGVGWYDLDIDEKPGIFKSTQPAWNDKNLSHISRKVKSDCFLAHIRASTVGDVNQSNCHPFTFAEYSMVHNGTIRNFEKYKRKLISEIDEDLFLHISGNTDSEHFFLLVMHYLRREKSLDKAVLKAMSWIVDVQKDDAGFSRLNIVITNGIEMLATRFGSKDQGSISLKYSESHIDDKLSSIKISSEILDDNQDEWKEVPDNHYIYINKKDMSLKIDNIKL